MKLKTGKLGYNFETGRFEIIFDNQSEPLELHCGNTMQAYKNGMWVDTRIEKSEDWYLVGLSEDISLLGLKVRLMD